MPITFLLSAQADLDGTSRRDLARRCAAGELVRLRRGIYLPADQWQGLTPWERERVRLAAVAGDQAAGRVLIQQSAATMWRLPTVGPQAKVMLLASGAAHGRSRGDLCWSERRLLEPVASVDGIPVTSRAQTVLDMAAYLPFEQAVPAMDHVLRIDHVQKLPALAKEDLRRLARQLTAGTRQARAYRVIDFADARAESPGESYSRALMYRHRLPIPELQREFHGPDGRLLGRTDFFWEEENLVGEFDGAVKYGLGPGSLQPGRDALVREKRREDRLRATGLGFVRWIWAEAARPSSHPDGLLQILLRAGLARRRQRRS
ncbi:MAG: type IV toxin-antitoxin system AbiEi family antitoxin domain-containing protein [Arthrobacter sp.]